MVPALREALAAGTGQETSTDLALHKNSKCLLLGRRKRGSGGRRKPTGSQQERGHRVPVPSP